jgi:hypothetical protein
MILQTNSDLSATIQAVLHFIHVSENIIKLTKTETSIESTLSAILKAFVSPFAPGYSNGGDNIKYRMSPTIWPVLEKNRDVKKA